MTRDEILEALRCILRTAEMSSGIMRDAQRTGDWEGSERVASQFDLIAERARRVYAALEAEPREPDNLAVERVCRALVGIRPSDSFDGYFDGGQEEADKLRNKVRNALQAAPRESSGAKVIDIVFDGPPGPTAGRFVEVEDGWGKSVRFGEWMERIDGYWVLRFPVSAARAALASAPEREKRK